MMPVILDEALKARIWAQMEASYPNEGGGFLLGEVRGKQVLISDVVGIPNTFAEEEQYHRYAMTPQNYERIEAQAEAQGLSLVGYYHSHPDALPVPSRFDRHYAWPNFIYLITSVASGKAVNSRAWRLRADRSRFNEAALRIQN